MGKGQHPKEFRDEVVAIARKRERPISQIAKDFGISGQTIYEWIKKDDADKGNGSSIDVAVVSDVDLRALKKRNRELEQELEVLRRATAYFSQAVLPK
jgi:transposase